MWKELKIIKIIISNISGIPIYEQIKEQIKTAVMHGELKENEMLPSLRKLSKELKVSVLTINRAYTELEQDSFIKNVQGKGSYVLGSSSELIKEQLIRDIEEYLSNAITLAKKADLSSKDLHRLLTILEEENLDE